MIAKPLTITYQPDKRVMFKIKHERTADCVVAGYRVHKSGDDAIGSLLLGLYKDDGTLASVGVIGAFPMAKRQQLFIELQPLVTTFDGHPWNWAAHKAGERTPRRNEGSRWNAGKDLSFVPLRPERVVEVRYDHMEGERFRHTAQFNRWRPDRDPRSCTYAQLEQPLTFSLGDIVPGLNGCAEHHRAEREATVAIHGRTRRQSCFANAGTASRGPTDTARPERCPDGETVGERMAWYHFGLGTRPNREHKFTGAAYEPRDSCPAGQRYLAQIAELVHQSPTT